MKHAGTIALDALEPLLRRLRSIAGLQEKTRGVFYHKSRALLHFHEDPTGLYADIRAPGEPEFERLSADGEEAVSAILSRVEAALSGVRTTIAKTQR
jgi:hypothetical protein